MAKRVYLAEIPTFARFDGTPDLEAVRHNVGRLVQLGYPRIAVAGTVGEYENLTVEDQKILIECAADAAKGRAEIAAGAFDAGTEKAASRIAEHKKAGCTTHLCVASHFFGLSHPDELIRHFTALRKAGGRLILVDSTAHTAFTLPADVLRDASVTGEIAVYVNSADPTRAREFREKAVISEEAELMNPNNAPFVSRLAVLFPHLILNHEKIGANARNALLMLLQTGRHPAAAIKYAAYILGLCACPDLLPPYAGLTEEEKRLIKAAVPIAQAEEERLSHE